MVGDGEAETGPAGHRVAFQQAARPDLRRGGAPDPPPQRLQDQQPDGPGPHRARGIGAIPPAAAGGRPISSKATTRRRCMSSWPRRWRPSYRGHKAHPGACPEWRRTDAARPRWPMIVLRSPKGWTGPKAVDGLQVEGTFRAHQVPLLVDPGHPDHVKQLEDWMKELQAGGALRRQRPPDARAGRARAERKPADGRESARQRRPTPARSADAGLPRACARRSLRPAPYLARTRSCWVSSCATCQR